MQLVKECLSQWYTCCAFRSRSILGPSHPAEHWTHAVLFRTLVPAHFESTAFLRWKLQAFRSRLVNTDRDAELLTTVRIRTSLTRSNLNADSRHEVTVEGECLLDQRPHLLRTGLSADQYISSHEAADRYHQHPLHETSPRHLQRHKLRLLSTSEQRFQRSLPLLISREVLLLWSVD
jgi:hypothetical protein